MTLYTVGYPGWHPSKRSRQTSYLLVAFWVAVSIVYLLSAVKHKERVNLSAAAAGQYPYLVYARGMAEQGVSRFLGDRNRMPLFPALLTLVYGEDWDTFFHRACWLAIGSSILVLVGIGIVAYSALPDWSATALTLCAAVCVFIQNASIAGAELLYYGLLFGSWLLTCRLIIQPKALEAALGGVLLGLTYLTKASALLTVLAIAAVVVFYTAALVSRACVKTRMLSRAATVRERLTRWRPVRFLTGAARKAAARKGAARKGAARKGLPTHALGGGVAGTTPQISDNRASLRHVVACTAIAVVSFLVVVFPYITTSRERFGAFFYNVNSSFFMWCDSWPQAKSFVDTYHVEIRPPDGAAANVPGPTNYWRTHTGSQILRRLTHGFWTIGKLAVEGRCCKYVVAVALFCLILGFKQRHRLRNVSTEYWMVVLFCGLFFGLQILCYAWYAQVAYGDRFILSLFLPALFALLWLGNRLSLATTGVPFWGRRVRKSDLLAIAMTAYLLGEGGSLAASSLYRPTGTFVLFYYNESHELLRAGQLEEAAKGFRGVLEFDDTFAPAHRDLGMAALYSGRFEEAIEPLTEAARLRPLDADIRNSLGSAYLRAGWIDDAIREFRQATQLSPSLAVAWYNLGVSYHQQGSKREAAEVLRHLRELDIDGARKLAALLQE